MNLGNVSIDKFKKKVSSGVRGMMGLRSGKGSGRHSSTRQSMAFKKATSVVLSGLESPLKGFSSTVGKGGLRMPNVEVGDVDNDAEAVAQEDSRSDSPSPKSAISKKSGMSFSRTSIWSGKKSNAPISPTMTNKSKSKFAGRKKSSVGSDLKAKKEDSKTALSDDRFKPFQLNLPKEKE